MIRRELDPNVRESLVAVRDSIVRIPDEVFRTQLLTDLGTTVFLHQLAQTAHDPLRIPAHEITDQTKYGDLLRKYRGRDLTQLELAERTGIRAPLIGRYEHGRALPPLLAQQYRLMLGMGLNSNEMATLVNRSGRIPEKIKPEDIPVIHKYEILTALSKLPSPLFDPLKDL